MKSIFIKPRDNKEFDKAFSMLVEFGKERKRLTLKDDEEISFAFLIKAGVEAPQVQEKVVSKKPAR